MSSGTMLLITWVIVIALFCFVKTLGFVLEYRDDRAYEKIRKRKEREEEILLLEHEMDLKPHWVRKAVGDCVHCNNPKPKKSKKNGFVVNRYYVPRAMPTSISGDKVTYSYGTGIDDYTFDRNQRALAEERARLEYEWKKQEEPEIRRLCDPR